MPLTTICTVDGCEKTEFARGWCQMHWSRWRRTGTTVRPPYGGDCRVPECDRPVKGRGYCKLHFDRLLRTGRPLLRSVPERFWEQVEKTDECWIWTGHKNRDGYGRFGVGGIQVQAHRWAYEESNGPIPKGLVIDHLCRVPSCVRPDHLEPVTLAENTTRGADHRRSERGKCSKGHPYTPENTYYRSTGFRECRQCALDRARENQRRGWPKARKAILARCGGWCEARTEACTGQASHVHHKKTRARGGGDDEGNLLAACPSCHKWIHGNPLEAQRLGLLLWSWEATP